MTATWFQSLFLACLFCATAATAQYANGIKAIVNDSVITLAEVETLVRPAADALSKARIPSAVFQQRVEEMMDKGLEELIENHLVLQDFKLAGYNFPEAIIDETVEERIRLTYGDDRAKLIKTLQSRGITYEQFRQNLRDQVIVEALTAKNVSQEIQISPHKIETFYVANQTKYKVDEQVKLRMIVLNNSATPARALADEIHRKLKEGAAFSEMASVYSEGAQRREGGSWGWVDRTVLRKELADVAFALKVGEFSDTVELGDTIYIMFVEDRRAGHTRPLSEIREEIERQLRGEEQQRLRKLYLDRLRKKTFVLYF
jgi:parvulin-like peptidyl-prolyl isomerase